MPNQFALNTAAYPTLSQVTFNTRDGMVDYKAQQVAGKITVPANQLIKLRRMREYPGPLGSPYFVES